MPSPSSTPRGLAAAAAARAPAHANANRVSLMLLAALTVFAYMGADALVPLLTTAAGARKGFSEVVAANSATPSGTASATTSPAASPSGTASASSSAAATASRTAAATPAPASMTPTPSAVPTASDSAAASPSAVAPSPSAAATPAASPSPAASSPLPAAPSLAAPPTVPGGADNEASRVVPAALPRTGAARLLRESPGARQRFWFDCLNASVRASCRPRTAAGALPAVLPLDEWRAHVVEVLAATARFRTVPVSTYAGYSGPWVENVFIAHYLGADGATPDWGRLDAFRPLVPLLLQWTDGTFGPDTSTNGPAKDFMTTRGGGLLRDDVLYAALSQHDRGEPASGLPCAAYSNVLVFSGGGWGSVGIPLIMGAVQPLAATLGDGAGLPRPGDATSLPRSIAASFAGSVWLGREGMEKLFRAGPLPQRLFQCGKSDWRAEARRAALVLAPRGYGRSSFRMFEMLQFGRVVVYLGDDTLWVPHQHQGDFAPSGLPHAEPARAPALVPVVSNGVDARAYGAVPPEDGAAAPAWGGVGGWRVEPDDAALVGEADAGAADAPKTVLNDGGIWGPGGVGFALRYADIPAFTCVACEFLLAGSAPRWRRVRVLPLHRYGPPGDGRACPCTAARWEEVVRALSSDGGATWVLPADSLVAEMERRVAAVGPSLFNYAAVMRNVRRFVADPLYDTGGGADSSGASDGSDAGYDAAVAAAAPLRCVPKPDTYGVPDNPAIERRRRRRRARRLGWAEASANGPEATEVTEEECAPSSAAQRILSWWDALPDGVCAFSPLD